MGPIVLWCHFRSQGVQWPLRDNDWIEVRSSDQRHLGEIPGYLVIELITHYFRGVQINQRLTEINHHPAPALPPPAKMPSRVVPIEVQEARRKKRRGKLLVLAFVFLAGCMTTNPAAWTHAPTAETRVRADIYECKAQAEDTLRYGVAFGGVIMPIVGLFNRRSVFRECMEARGYRQQ